MNISALIQKIKSNLQQKQDKSFNCPNLIRDFLHKNNNKKACSVLKTVVKLFAQTDTSKNHGYIYASNDGIAALCEDNVSKRTVINVINFLVESQLILRRVKTNRYGYSRRTLIINADLELLQAISEKNVARTERGILKRFKDLFNFAHQEEEKKKEKKQYKKKKEKSYKSIEMNADLTKLPVEISEFCQTHNTFPALYWKSQQAFREAMDFVNSQMDKIRNVGPYFYKVYKALKEKKTYETNRKISNIDKKLPAEKESKPMIIPDPTPEKTAGPANTHSPLVMVSLMMLGLTPAEKDSVLSHPSSKLESFFNANKSADKGMLLSFLGI